jgi:hypothetical protein
MRQRPIPVLTAATLFILGFSLLSDWSIKSEAAPEAQGAGTPTATSIPTSSLPGAVLPISTLTLNHSFALNSSNVPVITYFVNFNTSTVLMECNSSTDCSTPTQRYSQPGSEASVVVNSQGKAIVAQAYTNSLTKNMRLNFCTTPQCNYLSTYDVDSAYDPGHYASMALDNDIPVVSYYEATNGRLKMVRCDSSTSCSAASSTVRTLDTNLVGQYTSLALTSSGFPVISYYDGLNKNLKLAICSNKTCDTGTVTIRQIDSIGDVGQYTSLALTSGNIPVITYYDFTNARLKMAICNNATCDAPTIKLIDSSGQTGPYSSVKILKQAGDLPIIAYHHYATRDLRLAVCYDMACSTMAYFTLDSIGYTGTYISLQLDSQNHAVILYSSGFTSDQGRLYVGNYSFNTLPTLTPTDTPTSTPTNTPTDTPTNTPTDTPTNTPTDTPTNTPTNTPTDTPTSTPTNTPTNTPTSTLVPSPVPTTVPVAAPLQNQFNSQTPTLRWSALTWATRYEIQVDNIGGFDNPLEYSGSISGLQITTSTLPVGVHYWRVRGCDAADQCGIWSAVESFAIVP